MTKKQIDESIDVKKVEKGCRHIFSYMVREGFTLAEVCRLIVSMRDVKNRMLTVSPLKRISELNYSECIDDSMSWSFHSSDDQFCSCSSEKADS